MAYIGFTNKGYEYLSEGRYLLFTAGSTHNYLFDYVDKNLSHLPKLLEQYISKQMNMITFELSGVQHKNEEIGEITKILISAHPYYEHEYRTVIIKAIGEYFNTQLLYSRYYKRTFNQDISKKWYMDRITRLLAPLLMLGDTFPTDFYNWFNEKTGEEIYTGNASDDIETVIIDASRGKPTGFYREIQTQIATSNMLYLILDISVPELKQLTLPQRAWMHSIIFQMEYHQPAFSIPVQRSYYRPLQFRCGDRISEMEQARKLEDIFEPLYQLGNISIGHNGIPADMMAHFSQAVELAKSQATSELYSEYQIDDLQALLHLEIMDMIQNDTMIRRCRRCGKYFVVNNRKVAYCDRVDMSGVRCSAVGPQQNYQKKLEDDEPLKIYNRAYKTHFARVKKGTMSKDAFRLWYDEAKSKLAEVRKGNLDISDFQTWLKK